MRRAAVIGSAAAVALLAAASQIPAAGNSSNFFIGKKSVGDFEDLQLDSQIDFGAEISLAPGGWPVAFAVDFLVSTDKADIDLVTSTAAYDLDATATNFELDFGARRTWEVATSVRPYVGGGFALGQGRLEVNLEGNSASQTENGAGYWLGAGVYWKLTDRYNLGLNVRHSKIDIRFDGESRDVDIGGTHVGLVLGWGY